MLSSVRRVVVKVGSGVLTEKSGLNMALIRDLTKDLCGLREKGYEVILVSSGAISSGLRKLGFSSRPQSVSEQQAMAAVGQSSLMMAYEEAFGSHGYKVAQLLLTRDDLTHRRRYLNSRNTLFTLLSWNVVPIINENDTVVVDEIKFGDNDNLSAMVTTLTESQFLLNLTNIDGVFDRDPRIHKDAKLIPVVEKVDRNLLKIASSIPGFLGTGGMASKIRAAQKVALAGVPTVICNGLKPGIVARIFAGAEEGTLFLPREASLCSRKHWIAFTKSPQGELIIDRGAEEALVENGKSLLPSGILEASGRFSLGDSVMLKNQAGEDIAVGLTNYPSGEIRKILGAKSSEIEGILGYRYEDEVIHRDNLILLKNLEQEDELCRLQP